MMSNCTQPAAACPVLHCAPDATPPYVSYARMDAIYELAQPRTDSPHELNFILISHVKELLFRILYTQIDQARTRLRVDQPYEACDILGRAVRTQEVLRSSWEIVTAMSPDEFLEFRDALGEASGIQSFMYRALEFSLGNKDQRVVHYCANSLNLYPVLRHELLSPSLYDEALRHLHRIGFRLPDQVIERDVTAQYTADPQVEAVWLAVYQNRVRWPQAHRLAEALAELSYQFALWRANHLLVVERMLGSKPGTGGTSGLNWLRKVNEHRFFPELWSARTRL
jgi:tryptophan 2,3-dioxygenase